MNPVSVTKGPVMYALFFPAGMKVEGAQFLTKQTDDFQVGLMERQAGYEVKAHQHPSMNRTLTTTSEFLYFEKGKAEVTVFDEEWNELGRHTVSAGDFLVFLRGGHRMKVLEPARMIEVKQGPYPGDGSAKVFRD